MYEILQYRNIFPWAMIEYDPLRTYRAVDANGKKNNSIDLSLFQMGTFFLWGCIITPGPRAECLQFTIKA